MPVLDPVVVAWGGMPLIATRKRPLEGVTNEMVREDGWPDAAWPDFLGY